MKTQARKPRKPVRTIEVRRVPSLHPTACRNQWVVMIPLLFCHVGEALRYADHMRVAGNRMAPQIETVVKVIR